MARSNKQLVLISNYWIVIAGICLLATCSSSVGQHLIEDYIQFNKILGFDSIVVTNSSMLKEARIEYDNGQLESIHYFDNFDKPSQTRSISYFKCSVDGLVHLKEIKECQWLSLSNQPRRCVNFVTHSMLTNEFDKKKRVIKSILINPNGDSLISEFAYKKRAITIKHTGWWNGVSFLMFDKQGRQTSLIDSFQNGDTIRSETITYESDGWALIQSESFRQYDGKKLARPLVSNWSFYVDRKGLVKEFRADKVYNLTYYR